MSEVLFSVELRCYHHLFGCMHSFALIPYPHHGEYDFAVLAWWARFSLTTPRLPPVTVTCKTRAQAERVYKAAKDYVRSQSVSADAEVDR